MLGIVPSDGANVFPPGFVQDKSNEECSEAVGKSEISQESADADSEGGDDGKSAAWEECGSASSQFTIENDLSEAASEWTATPARDHTLRSSKSRSSNDPPAAWSGVGGKFSVAQSKNSSKGLLGSRHSQKSNASGPRGRKSPHGSFVPDASSDPDAIRKLLDAEKTASWKRRLRITLPCISGGISLLAVGTCATSLGYEFWREINQRLVVVIVGVCASGLIMCFLGILPTDRRAIRALALLCLFFSSSMAIQQWQWMSQQVLDVLDGGGCLLYDVFAVPCWVCAAFAIINFCIGSVLFVGTALLVRGLVRLHPRALLDYCWLCLSRSLRFYGLSRIPNLIVLLIAFPHLDVEEAIQWFRIREVALMIEMWLIGALVGRNSFRVRAQAWLGQQGETQTQAGAIAALMGGESSENLIDTAGKLFKCISCDQITQAMMSDSSGAVFDKGLYQLSRFAKLGEVDAFFSHSWHDDSGAKWQQIQEWRSNFKSKFHREPTIWLDKCCIDQNNIAENLKCLPVFLAGCKTLLIVAGNTYLERLWCVVEIFVFLAMGGSPDDLELRILSAGDECNLETFHMAVGHFDAEDCMCFCEDDKDRLLTFVEAGFGDLGEFNHALKDVFRKALDNLTPP